MIAAQTEFIHKPEDSYLGELAEYSIILTANVIPVFHCITQQVTNTLYHMLARFLHFSRTFWFCELAIPMMLLMYMYIVCMYVCISNFRLAPNLTLHV